MAPLPTASQSKLEIWGKTQRESAWCCKSIWKKNLWGWNPPSAKSSGSNWNTLFMRNVQSRLRVGQHACL